MVAVIIVLGYVVGFMAWHWRIFLPLIRAWFIRKWQGAVARWRRLRGRHQD